MNQIVRGWGRGEKKSPRQFQDWDGDTGSPWAAFLFAPGRHWSCARWNGQTERGESRSNSFGPESDWRANRSRTPTKNRETNGDRNTHKCNRSFSHSPGKVFWIWYLYCYLRGREALPASLNILLWGKDTEMNTCHLILLD